MEIASLAPFEKTVAGSTPFLFAQNFPGKVFKPAHPREKEFYETLDKHPILSSIVPKYHGTLTYLPAGSDITHQAAEYLVMEDLTYGFSHPCILDVKLGTTHHDIDFTNPQLQPPRQSKYLTAPLLGFCLTGMQVYKSVSGGYEFMDKAEGRHLTQTTVVDKLAYFFQDGRTLRHDVITKFIQRLTQVASYFQNKPAFTFRSSSLLLLYEGKHTAESADRVEVKMIDFAHAKRLPISIDFKDEYGYLYGTNNFIKILESFKAHPDFDIPTPLPPQHETDTPSPAQHGSADIPTYPHHEIPAHLQPDFDFLSPHSRRRDPDFPSLPPHSSSLLDSETPYPQPPLEASGKPLSAKPHHATSDKPQSDSHIDREKDTNPRLC